MWIYRIPIWFLIPAAGASLLLALFFSALCWFFGSTHAGLAYLGGASLVASPSSVDLGHVAAGERREFEVTLQNLDSCSIKIIGARSSCTCIATHGLPRDVDSGQTIALKVYLVVPRGQSELVQSLTYYTDSSDSPQVAVKVRGVVSTPSS
jgi:hypothetical protein